MLLLLICQINFMATITEKLNRLGISDGEINNVIVVFRKEIEKINNDDKAFQKLNPFYTEGDIEILVFRYLESWHNVIETAMSKNSLGLQLDEAKVFALNHVVGEMRTLGNAVLTTIAGKNCKWCKNFFQGDDDFCSPECLENYANHFLKQQDLS